MEQIDYTQDDWLDNELPTRAMTDEERYEAQGFRPYVPTPADQLKTAVVQDDEHTQTTIVMNKGYSFWEKVMYNAGQVSMMANGSKGVWIAEVIKCLCNRQYCDEWFWFLKECYCESEE